MTTHASTRRFWETRATVLTRRINAAAWLERIAPACFLVASVFAVTVYSMRRAEIPLRPAWFALAAMLAVAAITCWWRARRKFFGVAESRVLLESHLRLDTRLTAAGLGLVPWPAVPVVIPPIVRWQLGTAAGWLATSAGLLALALFVPVPGNATGARASGSPPALLQTEEMLAALKDMKAAEPQAIEQLEERARELARRPTDEQYSHSALEAADALRNQTIVSTTGLARGLDAAAKALRDANSSSDMNGPAGHLAAALAGLRDGALPLNKDLLSQLPGSLADLNNLTAEQRAQLAGQLADIAKGLQGIAGAAGAGAQVAQPDPDALVPGFGSEADGGTAPLMFSDQPSGGGKGKLQALAPGDLKRFAPGDKLGTTNSAHDVDPAKTAGPSAAGTVAAPASGGEAVWVNRLTPAERAALIKFFQ